MTDARVLSGLAATIAIARVTWTRALRTWATIGAAMIAALPVMVASALHGSHHDNRLLVYRIAELGAIVIAGLVVAGAIGEEFEDRTMTYLWSRPLPRWSVVTGKLAALTPLAAALYAGTLAASFSLMTGDTDARGSIADAVAAAALAMVAMSAVAAAMATLLPRQALAMTVVYLFIFDLAVGLIPARVQMVSISFHALQVARLGHTESQATAVIALVVIAAAWLAVAMWRVRRIE